MVFAICVDYPTVMRVDEIIAGIKPFYVID
jgi:hypothetical protein